MQTYGGNVEGQKAKVADETIYARVYSVSQVVPRVTRLLLTWRTFIGHVAMRVITLRQHKAFPTLCNSIVGYAGA